MVVFLTIFYMFVIEVAERFLGFETMIKIALILLLAFTANIAMKQQKSL